MNQLAATAMHDDPLPTPPLAHLHFESDPWAIAHVIAEIMEACALALGCSDTAASLEIVLAEVLNNITEHAYQGRPGQPVEAKVKLRNGGLHFHFSDRGCPMPDGRLPSGDLPALACPKAQLPEGGFGWHLIRRLTRNLSYERLGAVNHLRFCFPI